MKYSESKYLLDLNSLANFQQCYIYGTGQTSRKFREFTSRRKKSMRILGYIDSYRKTSISDEISIFNIKDFTDIDERIIICSYNEEWIDEIVESLRNRGAENFYINMIILDSYFSLSESKYKAFRKKTSYIDGRLATELDRTIWRSVVRALRDNNDNQGLFENYYSHGSQQYLDLLTINSDDIVIEGGVFDGLTTQRIASKLGHNGKLYGFDPLIVTHGTGVSRNENICIIKKALWNRAVTLYFVNKGAGSYVSEVREEFLAANSQFEVEGITIDFFVCAEKLERFDFLKLDVEGAELKVLHGGMESIKKFRPKLAVSIYHSLNDFFEIPYLLMTELSDYSFHVRLYSGALMDTILYALPNEREISEPRRSKIT